MVQNPLKCGQKWAEREAEHAPGGREMVRNWTSQDVRRSELVGNRTSLDVPISTSDDDLKCRQNDVERTSWPGPKFTTIGGP